MSKLIVLKFGGSSQCQEGLKTILGKINEYQNLHYKIILVISAVGKTTNHLYDITKFNNKYDTIYSEHKLFCSLIDISFTEVEQLLIELKQDIENYNSKPFIDSIQQKIKIISYGEFIASKIVHLFLIKNGTFNDYLNSHMFIKNTATSDMIDVDNLNIKGKFYCDKLVIDNIVNNSSNSVFVTQGFVAKTKDNKYAVLTRSGSNTTASLISAKLDAERLEIWTDVCGLYTSDPRKIQNAKLIPYISYEVAQESSAWGTQLIHPYSIVPCEKKNIPIYIKNTFDPNSAGSIINGKPKTNDNIYLVCIQNSITTFKIKSLDMSDEFGCASDIFDNFKKEKININIITTSQFEISTTTNENDKNKLEKIKERIELGDYKVNMVENCSIVSIIADNINNNLKVQNVHKLVSELISGLNERIYITHYSSNNMTLSYVVNEKYSLRIAKLLHEQLIENCNF